MERRLAAILAADVVGYSRLMGECQRRSNKGPRGGVNVGHSGSVISLSPKSTGGARARRGLPLIGQRRWRAWEGPVGPRGQADAA